MNSVAMWADEPSGEVEIIAAILPNFVDFYRDERDPIARTVAMTIGDAILAKEAVDEAMTRPTPGGRPCKPSTTPAAGSTAWR